MREQLADAVRELPRDTSSHVGTWKIGCPKIDHARRSQRIKERENNGLVLAVRKLRSVAAEDALMHEQQAFHLRQLAHLVAGITSHITRGTKA